MTTTIFDHANLAAWEVIPYDRPDRTARERAEMLARLGFGRYAYISASERWMDPPLTRAEVRRDTAEEIAAMRNAGIDISSWYLWLDDEEHLEDDVELRPTLEAIAEAGISPQLWVAQSHARTAGRMPVLRYLPPGTTPSAGWYEREDVRNAAARAEVEDAPSTLVDYDARVAREASRIAAVRSIAAEYGCRVHLYNHRDWFGRLENQLRILDRLRAGGIDDVGLVYNFSHSWDRFHDDLQHFDHLWSLIREHVVAVNVLGRELGHETVSYPSQGIGELEMLRTIARSGWESPVGVLQWRTTDSEGFFTHALCGIDWLAAEIAEPGSGGPRPDLPAPAAPGWTA